MKSDGNAQTPSFGSFVNYKNVVNTLTADLDKLRGFYQTLKLDVKLIDEVLKRTQADSFTTAVVGEFKRGKSTFINALLGKEILPSDILPCSATLNRVKYSLTPSVTVTFKDGHEEQVAIEQLANYVTKLTEESEQTAAFVKEAVVYYPVPFCQNNVEIIDTPGLNDDANMTEVTLSVLPQVDAAILVIMAQAPFGEYERDFLENKLLSNDLGRVIFVVTGIDRFNRPEDADKVIKHIEERIQKYVLQRAEEQFGKDSTNYEVYLKKIGKPKVFGLSAYQYLEGKQLNDSALIASSRFEQFVSGLETFLTQDRGSIVLQVPVNRVIASSAEILKAIGIQESALEMNQEKFQLAYEESVAEIEAIRKRKKEEMALIDKAADNVKHRVRPLISELPKLLKQAAEEAIDNTDIKPNELNNPKVLSENMGNKVTSAVQRASRGLSELIQREVQEGINREVERLKDFTQSVDEALKRIEVKFVQIPVNANRKTNATGEAITAVISTFTTFGGIWSGYRVAGVKGAIAGAGASLVTSFATYCIAIMLGITTLSLPLVAIAGVASAFTGDWFSKAIFSKERLKTFKTNYKAKVLEEIDKQLQQQLENNINHHISDRFSDLKEALQKEVESLLDNTQKTLDELRTKRAENKVLTENERNEIDEIRVETQRIIGNAERLSKQLVQIMSI